MRVLPGVSISRLLVPVRRTWMFPYFGIRVGRRWYFPIGWGGGRSCQSCLAESNRRHIAEAELARLADVIVMLSGAHVNTGPDRHLNKCQACRMFREMAEEPSVQAAQQRLHDAVASALRAGVRGCPAMEDRDEGRTP